MSTNLPDSAKLSSKAVIAQLNIGSWRTKKVHADETRAENARHGLTNEATVDVDICKHPALDMIDTLHNMARSEHYRLTMATETKGMRLLPGARQIEHSRVMLDIAGKVDALVRQFMDDYDAEKAKAPARLKGLYLAKHWPSHDAVRAKFYFQTRYLPAPDQGQWAEWLAEAAVAATDDLRSRLREAVLKVASKLKDPKAIFRDSLTGNLVDLLALVPDLNLSEDPTIKQLADSAAALVEFEPDTLRDDPIARANVASKAADICSMFNLS